LPLAAPNGAQYARSNVQLQDHPQRHIFAASMFDSALVKQSTEIAAVPHENGTFPPVALHF
jgi:hypothetical protein